MDIAILSNRLAFVSRDVSYCGRAAKIFGSSMVAPIKNPQPFGRGLFHNNLLIKLIILLVGPPGLEPGTKGL